MDKIQSFTESLTETVNSLGSVYLNMADHYPQFLSSLDQQLKSLQDENHDVGSFDRVVTMIKESVARGTRLHERYWDK